MPQIFRLYFSLDLHAFSEIEQQSYGFTGRVQIVHKLRFVHWSEFRDGFDFNDYLASNQNVRSKLSNDVITIANRNRDFKSCVDTF